MADSRSATALETFDAATADSDELAEHYQCVRKFTETLCDPLEPEDFLLQSMPDASPAKWHLAHTTWFFETFLLQQFHADYRPYRPEFNFLFNSYYDAVGDRWPRPSRGLLSRPTVGEVYAYRQTIDERLAALAGRLDADNWHEFARMVELGLHHEQQHQELLMTDIKHAFGVNPLRPAYHTTDDDYPTGGDAPAVSWRRHEAGLHELGGGGGFCFDNERPRHRVYLQNFEVADRLVTAGEFLEFIDDDGYERPDLWLSDGWAMVNQGQWRHPLYWEPSPAGWAIMTLHGLRPLHRDEPVCHVSFYEADAFARWAGCRLPTEAEWDAAAADSPPAGNFVESAYLHPVPAARSGPQFLGDAWEWTASPYTAYPGYKAPDGALGEYNAKFMCNQMVLRGGSCVSSRGHVRPGYRNFFPPEARWQFSGFRLARDT